MAVPSSKLTDLTARTSLDPTHLIYSVDPAGATDEKGAKVTLSSLLTFLAAYFPKAKPNLTATTDPGVGDDTADGYGIGSLWINTTTPEAFLLLDATAGAAVWSSLGSSGIADGSVTLAKLADLANGKILARVTAGTGVPEAASLSAVLDLVGSAANGDILYRSGGVWTRLGIGSDGQVLKLASGLPTWAAESLAAIADGRILANTSGGSAAPVATTLSTVLDLVGSAANGDILYRSGGSWTRLGIGSDGQVLKLASGLPTWAAEAAASGGSAVSQAIAQTGHGFAVGDCVGYVTSGSAWAKSQTNAINTIGSGIVTAVADVDNFTVTLSGVATGLSGLTAGTWYYQSDATPGALTTTPPTAGDSYVVPVLYALSTTSGIVIPPIPHARGQALLPKLDVAAGALASGDDLTYVNGAWVAKSITDYASLTGIALDDEGRIWDTSAGVPKKITPVEFLKVLNLLTEDTSPAINSDFGLVYDTSAGTVKKVKLSAMGAGKVAQVAHASTSTKSTFTTVLPHDNTTPQNTEGTEVLTCSITPTNASSYLLIEFSGCFGVSAASAVNYAIFVNSTADAIFAGNITQTYANICQFFFRVAAGSTAARTYKVRVGPTGATSIYWNSNNINSSLFNGLCYTTMTVTEILP